MCSSAFKPADYATDDSIDGLVRLDDVVVTPEVVVPEVADLLGEEVLETYPLVRAIRAGASLWAVTAISPVMT